MEPTNEMTFEVLQALVMDSAALRRVQRLQPSTGYGTKMFPPAFREPGRSPWRHICERHRRDGVDTWCVALDSVQSQANRMEAALKSIMAQHKDAPPGLPLPHIRVVFGDTLSRMRNVTSLDAPNRVYDAIMRDSETADGTPFPNSNDGRALQRASPDDATALLEVGPAALLFGTSCEGSRTARFARAITSEILAVGIPGEEVTGRTTYANAYTPTAGPGVTCEFAEQRMMISFQMIRKLRFGGRFAGGERQIAAWTLIAALGLVAVVELDEQGYELRSRCSLVREGERRWEVVTMSGGTSWIAFERSTAHALYEEAYAKCRALRFNFRWLELRPQSKLVELIRSSPVRKLSDEARTETYQ